MNCSGFCDIKSACLLFHHRKVSIWNRSSWVSLILVNPPNLNRVDQNWLFWAPLLRTTRRYCMLCKKAVSKAEDSHGGGAVQETLQGMDGPTLRLFSLGVLTGFEKFSAIPSAAVPFHSFTVSLQHGCSSHSVSRSSSSARPCSGPLIPTVCVSVYPDPSAACLFFISLLFKPI